MSGRPVRFNPIAATPPSPDSGFVVYRSAEEWHGPGLGIDFGDQMLLVVSAGMAPTGGSSVSVRRVVQAGGEVHVEVLHVTPGQGCPVPQQPTWVGQVVAVERVELPIRFHVASSQSPPCLAPPVVQAECWVDPGGAKASTLHVPLGATVVCDGSRSRIDGGRGGPPASGRWELVSVPPGSTVNASGFAQGPTARVGIDVAGTYELRLTIADSQGTTASTPVTLVAGPALQQVVARLVWVSTQAGPAPQLPLVLSVRRGGGRGCSPGASPLPAWCEAGPLEDPTRSGGFVRIPIEQARKRFRIVVEYPEGNRPEDAVAEVTLHVDGNLAGRWRDNETREPRAVWEVVGFELPAVTIE